MPSKFRILVLACGALDCFAVGTCYLFGVFQPYIMDYYGVDSATATTPYTLVWIIFTLGQFIAGPLLKRVGVKMAAVAGLACMGAGYAIASILDPGAFFAFSAVYILLFGIGLGVAYNVVAATVVRWFPDRKGVATSVSIGMMGGAGILLAPVFGGLLEQAGLLVSLRVMALLMIPCILFTHAVLRDIPAGYMADYVPPAKAANSKPVRECTDMKDLIATADAWLLVALYFSLVPVYLIVSGVFVSFGSGVKGLDVQTAVWFVSAASITQVVGRFVIPSASDRVGRRAAFLSVLGIMGVSAALLVGGSGLIYAVAFCLLSFAYGGGVTAMPSIITDRLGTTNATQNIAFAEIGTLAGSVVSTMLINTFATTPALIIGGAVACTLGIGSLLAIYRKA